MQFKKNILFKFCYLKLSKAPEVKSVKSGQRWKLRQIAFQVDLRSMWARNSSAVKAKRLSSWNHEIKKHEHSWTFMNFHELQKVMKLYSFKAIALHWSTGMLRLSLAKLWNPNHSFLSFYDAWLRRWVWSRALSSNRACRQGDSVSLHEDTTA